MRQASAHCHTCSLLPALSGKIRSSSLRPASYRHVRSCRTGRHIHKRSLVRCEVQQNGVYSGGSDDSTENLVIIGSGPAGYTAAIYAARANMRPLVFEGYQKGGSRGGQLMTTSEVENFPGFPEGITGPDLMDRMRAQAERWGAVLRTEDVDSVDFSKRPFTVKTSEVEVKANSIIIATGATAKRLGVPSEQKFWNSGISACAICDGANHAFKGQDLAVVGGGDTAAEEALFLTKYGKLVHMLVRGEQLRASNTLQDRVEAHKKINIMYKTTVEDAYGDGFLSGLHILDSGEKRNLAVKGLFYGIGHQPNSSVFQGQIELDAAGYIKVSKGVNTNVEGVYAAGDIHDHEWRQAVTAAGAGCQAALSAERYLSETGLLREIHQAGFQVERGQEAPPQEEDATSADEVDITQARHRGQFALRRLYHESDRVLLVMYSQPSCGPCRSLKPVLSKIIDEFPGKVHYIEINIEKDREIAEAAGVGGTPTVQLFKAKERLHHLPGVKNKSEYRDLIQSNL